MHQVVNRDGHTRLIGFHNGVSLSVTQNMFAFVHGDKQYVDGLLSQILIHKDLRNGPVVPPMHQRDPACLHHVYHIVHMQVVCRRRKVLPCVLLDIRPARLPNGSGHMLIRQAGDADIPQSVRPHHTLHGDERLRDMQRIMIKMGMCGKRDVHFDFWEVDWKPPAPCGIVAPRIYQDGQTQRGNDPHARMPEIIHQNRCGGRHLFSLLNTPQLLVVDLK